MRYLIILLIVASCNPVRQVLRDSAKTTTVVNAYLTNNPIGSDTVYKTIPGDSVVSILSFTDTVNVRDTMNLIVERTVNKYLTRIVKTTDTVVKTVIDRTFQQALQQQVVSTKVVLDQRVKELSEMKTSRNKFRSWFWVIVGIIGVSGAVAIYTKIKTGAIT